MASHRYVIRMCKIVFLGALLLAGIWRGPNVVWAQSAAAAGQIVGQVLDPSAGSVAGAEVTVRNTNTNHTRTATTDGEGRYAIPELPLGPYEVSVKASGFAADMQDAYVSLGASVSSNFRLLVQPTTETTEVVAADAPGIEPTRSATKSILTDLQIHELPSEGRRLQNFVVDTPQALIEPECRGFSISGQKGIYSNIAIDGGDYDSTWGCGIRARSESGPAFSLGAIQELQVVRNTFSAEFGRSTGGVIQLSTKSGTNSLHGTAFELNRDGALSEPDAFGHQAISSDNQFGGSLGGPIIKNRTFFFTAPEFQIANKPVQVLYGLTPATSVTTGATDLLAAAPQGTFNAVSNAQAVITRIDHQLTQNNQLFGRFDFARTLQTNSPGADNLSTGLGIATTSTAAASNQITQPDTNYTLLGQLTSTLSSSHLNELRIQFSREIRPRIPLGTGPQVSITNIATYGTPPAGSWGNEGFASTDNRYQLVDNFSIVSGAHTTKFGVDYQRIAGTALYDQNAGGAYTFNNLTDFANHTPDLYTQFTGTGSVSLTIHEIAGYIQDEWRILPGVTINPGFRYEAQLNPNYYQATNPAGRYPEATFIPDDIRMLAPRLGVAWDVGNAGKTVIRAGGGLYYAPTYMSMFAQSVLFNGGNPDRAYSVSITGQPAIISAFQSVGVNLATSPLNNLPTFTPSEFAALLANPNTKGLNSASYIGPDFRNPDALQWQVSGEHEIARGVTVSENFTYINTNGIARERDTNLPAPVPSSSLAYNASTCPYCGIPGLNLYNQSPRPDPAFGVATITESADHSLYRGFTTTLNVRRSHFTWDLYYTRSWNFTDEDAERGFTSIRYDDVSNLNSEYAHSNIDEPNQFWSNGVYEFPLGFEAGFSTRFTSGRPFNAVTGVDENGDGQNTDRPIINGVLIPRNAYRNYGFKDIDLRVQKSFALPNEKGTIAISAEFFNLANFANVQLAGAQLTYGLGEQYVGTTNPVLVNVGPQPTFGQLRNAQGQFIQTNTAGDPFQAQLGLRFQF